MNLDATCIAWTPVRTYPGGRTCAVDGCGTVLSRYNPSTFCSTHEPEPDWRWHGMTFAVCPACGHIIEARQNATSHRCGQCGVRFDVTGVFSDEPAPDPCGEKTCTSCGETLPIDQFRIRDSRKGDRRGRCRECDRKRDRQRYLSDPDMKRRINERNKRYRAEQKLAGMNPNRSAS